MARVTLRVWFEELFAAVEAMELAGPVQHLCSTFVAGIKHLPVTLRFAPGAARLLQAEFLAGSRV